MSQQRTEKLNFWLRVTGVAWAYFKARFVSTPMVSTPIVNTPMVMTSLVLALLALSPNVIAPLFLSQEARAQNGEDVTRALPMAEGFLQRCLTAGWSPDKPLFEALGVWLKKQNNGKGCVALFKALKKSKTLELENASLRNLDALVGFNHFTAVYLAGNSLSDLYFLQGSKSLKTLDVRGNPIRKIEPELLVRLQSLNISGTQIASLGEVSAAWDLRELYAHYLGLSDLAGVEHFKNLETLGVTQNRLFDLSPMAELKNLKFAYLSFNFIDDVTTLSQLPLLRLIHLTGNNLPDQVCPVAAAQCVF